MSSSLDSVKPWILKVVAATSSVINVCEIHGTTLCCIISTISLGTPESHINHLRSPIPTRKPGAVPRGFGITSAPSGNWVGVPLGKLTSFGNLNQFAIKPAVREINALASFGVTVMPIKNGRKVISVKVGWWQKTVDELETAFSELQRPKVGRKARILGTVETSLPSALA